jgi:hypothetical protein
MPPMRTEPARLIRGRRRNCGRRRELCSRTVPAQSERNDVEVVFNAKKYGAALITADGGSRRQPGGILGNRTALSRLGVSVVTDAEAVELVRRKIAERDARLRAQAARNGTVLPPWVGAD